MKPDNSQYHIEPNRNVTNTHMKSAQGPLACLQ